MYIQYKLLVGGDSIVASVLEEDDDEDSVQGDEWRNKAEDSGKEEAWNGEATLVDNNNKNWEGNNFFMGKSEER